MTEATTKPVLIDLFSGAGGLSLGAMRAGFSIAVAVELDPHAIDTHKTNFPEVCHLQYDITLLSGDKILELSDIMRNQLVGVIGGPPCQGFSSIGHKQVDDLRNRLFVKFFELVNELQPVFFVAENVPGIMNSKYNEVRQEAFSFVRGFHMLDPIKIVASEYGAPTTRTRVFFIGYRDDPRISPISISDIENKKVPEQLKTTVQQALEGLPGILPPSSCSTGFMPLNPEYYDRQSKHLQSSFFYSRIYDSIPSGAGDPAYIKLFNDKHIVNGCIPTKHTDEVEKRFSKLEYGQRETISKSARLHPDKYCPTLRAGTGPERGSYQAVRPIHYKYSRVITPREAARLQGFPDWYKLPETIWHGFRQIGNSVSPIVAERVLSALFQKLTLK